MLYNTAEVELMASAQQPNMRVSSPRTYANLLQVVNDFLGHIDFTGTNVLDVGPGKCDLLDILKDRGAITHGADKDPAVVRLGQMRGHKMEQGDLSTDWWPFEGVTFDGIFCRGSVNCFWFTKDGTVNQLDVFLKKISAALNHNGWIWFLPWNYLASPDPKMATQVQNQVTSWIHSIKGQIEICSQETISKYGLNYNLSHIEIWTKNCLPLLKP